LFLLILYVGDRFSPPPDSASEIAWTGLIATVVLLAWTWWFDHHRDARPGIQAGGQQGLP